MAPGERCSYCLPVPLRGGKQTFITAFLSKHIHRCTLKELGGRCKLDHFSDKRKMPSNFLLVQKGEKIENTWHFQGQESWLEPVSPIKSHIYHSVHLPTSRHHRVKNDLWRLFCLRKKVDAVPFLSGLLPY